MDRANRLVNETSPYLRQHAHNPVDWYPWGEAALERARREDKPILLSIGYSACHWCHVMEHESFEDEEVARAMNERFVCVKVDREERPDLDKVYQTAHQLLAQRAGGWPLTVFLTPGDLMPFFAGTYFPKQPRYGMPGFVNLLERVARAWREQREAIVAQNESLREVFGRLERTGDREAATLDPGLLEHAVTELRGQHDARHGGFGAAPKFPHPTSLELLLRRISRSEGANEPSFEIARHTLAAMARGGVYDQLGGGFYRYSVDERWEIPHFEKMLYDNAQLLPLYAELAVLTDDVRFREVAQATAGWIMHEMQAPDGGYYSTLDADSEGHEGKYYVWDRDEVRALLAPAEYDVIERRFGLDGGPNFEGKWHFNVRAETDAIARDLGQSEAAVLALLQAARARLHAARGKRVRPGRDEKVLASWNGLAIRGMARAGRLLGRNDLVDSATRAFDFVRERLWRDGRLHAVTKDGRTQLNAYLDDHVFLVDGALELLQARWRTEDLQFAVDLADDVLERFEDRAEGGFYFTSSDHERLIHRPKPTADEAVPAGNGVAAQVLLRLGYLLGEPRYLEAGERALQGAAARLASYPSAHASLLIALDEHVNPSTTVIVRGASQDLPEWQDWLRRHAPRAAAFAIPDDAGQLPGLLAERKNRGGATAYVCRGHACQPPAADLAALRALLP